MKKINFVIIGLSLSSLVIGAGGLPKPKELKEPGKENKSKVVPGLGVERKNEGEVKIQAPKAGSGGVVESNSNRKSSGTSEVKTEMGGAKAGSHGSNPSTKSEALSTVKSGRAEATASDTFKFDSVFSKELKDKVSTVDGKKVYDNKAVEAASEAFKKEAKLVDIPADTAGKPKRTKVERLKAASEKAYEGEFESTIEKILGETDELLKGDVEWMLRTLVRTHYTNNKNSTNPAAAKAELATILKEFMSISAQAKELLKDSKNGPELAKKLMRGMVAQYMVSPEKALEFAKSVESWLKDEKLTKAEKATTLEGLAITMDTFGGAISKSLAEGKTFEEALRSADDALAALLKEKNLSAEDAAELAKNCIPGYGMRAAAAALARMTSH